MKANCLFCWRLDPTKGRPDCLGECSVRKKDVYQHHVNCTTFAKWGPYYEGMLTWLRNKANRINRVADMIEKEAPEFYASVDTHEKRSQK